MRVNVPTTDYCLLIIVFFGAAVEIISSNYHKNLEKLKKFQKTINHDGLLLKQYGHDPDTPAQLLFKNGVYKDQFDGMPVLFWKVDFPNHVIGNHMGAYFDSVACAHVTGMHFVGLDPRFEPQEHFNDAFPLLIPHKNPLPDNEREEWLKRVNEKCFCGRYCWQPGQPWEKIIPFIRKTMLNALTQHRNHVTVRYNQDFQAMATDYIMPEIRGLVIEKNDLHVGANTSQFLPLFPDVAIHYRCSDNLFNGMGCLGFRYIFSHIPAQSKYIYIFAEYGSRQDRQIMSPHAEPILKALMDDIKERFPEVVVVIKRGSNVFTTMTQFAFAGVLICSPSTFCFYPAMAREDLTYFPLSRKRGGYVDTHEEIHPNFHFLREDNLYYNNFTATTTTSEVLQTLRQGTQLQ